MTFTRVGIIVVITAVAVYLGLNFLLPRNRAEQKEASATTADQVFSGNTSSTPAPPADNAAPAAAPATPVETAGGSSAAPAPAQGLSEDEARKIAEQVGNKTGAEVAASTVPNGQPAAPAAPAESAPAAAPSTTEAAGGSAPPPAPAQGLSEEEARKIAEEVSRKTATEVASSVASGSQPAATPPPAEPAPAAAAEPPPAGPAPAQPAAEAPAPAAEAPAPAPKKSKPAKAKKQPAAPSAASVAAAPAHAKSAAKAGKGEPSTDAVTSWWPVVDKQDPNKLNLTYAGEAAFDKAVVLLFSDNMGATSGGYIQLLDARGKQAPGHWEVGKQNSRMLIFKTPPGRYTVILSPDLVGASGKVLGAGLHGPVYVH